MEFSVRTILKDIVSGGEFPLKFPGVERHEDDAERDCHTGVWIPDTHRIWSEN
jgi:hypothetical protein